MTSASHADSTLAAATAPRTPLRRSRWRRAAWLPVLALSACTTVELDPLMQSDIEQRVRDDAAEMQADMAPVTAPITLAEAVARSLKFNLDNKLKLMEVIVADDRLELAHYDLLPRLAAEAGYSHRSNVNAASSESIRTRRESLEPSTSQDQGLSYANLETSWNVLDFGINYLSARQAGNQVLITVERERKIVQNIVKDVRYAYWRLVGARRLQQQLVPLIADVQGALDRARQIEAAKLKGTKDALEYQRRLLELKRELVRLEQDLHEARIELTALMGLTPGTQFTLADEQSAREAAELTALIGEDPAALHQFALRSRPELLEEDYRTRIAQLDVEKARWSWVPGFELYAGAYYDDNSYLVNQDWALYGVRLTWNLIKALSAPSAIRTAEDEKRLADIRRMALSAAVMTQVDVAALRYKLSSQTFGLNRELLDVDQRLLDQVQKEYEAKTTDELVFLETRARKLVAQLRLRREQASFLLSHGTTDIAHTADLRAVIAGLDLGDGEWDEMDQAAQVAGRLYHAMYDHEGYA